jgi:hypothetical protein
MRHYGISFPVLKKVKTYVLVPAGVSVGDLVAKLVQGLSFSLLRSDGSGILRFRCGEGCGGCGLRLGLGLRFRLGLGI